MTPTNPGYVLWVQHPFGGHDMYTYNNEEIAREAVKTFSEIYPRSRVILQRLTAETLQEWPGEEKTT